MKVEDYRYVLSSRRRHTRYIGDWSSDVCSSDLTFKPVSGTLPQTGNGPSAIVAGDFNADGKLDLAVVNQTDSTVSIFLGNGDGTFKARTDIDRKSTRLNSSHRCISYAVFCLKKKNK